MESTNRLMRHLEVGLHFFTPPDLMCIIIDRQKKNTIIQCAFPAVVTHRADNFLPTRLGDRTAFWANK